MTMTTMTTMKQFLLPLVALVLLITMAMPVWLTQAKQKYQPALEHQEVRELTLTPEDPIAFFRVTVPQSADSNFFEVLFSACTAGTIRVSYSSCVLGTAGCDNGSVQWFPNGTNAHRTHYSIVSEEFHLQETQSIGKIGNYQPSIRQAHYYGVEMVNSGKSDQLVVQAELKYYSEGGVTGSFVSESKVNMHLKTGALEWDKLVYCRRAYPSALSQCENKFVVDPVEYTAYIVRADKHENVNLGTACGMHRAVSAKNVKKLVTKAQATEINIASHVKSNGTYLIGVGAQASAIDTDPEVDFAYEPLIYTIKRESTSSGMDPTLIIVLLVFVVLGAVTCVLALAGGLGFYLYRRHAASKSADLGEFTPLTGTAVE